MLLPLSLMMTTSLATNEFAWFFYYFTFWGFFLSYLHILASIKAANYKEWQVVAVLSGELSVALNIGITIVFWVILAPILFPLILNNLYMIVHLTTLHSLPLIFTLLNFRLTDMQYRSKDWTFILAAGLIYIFANWLGTIKMGHEVYPIAEWKDPEKTFIMYFSLALFDAGVYLIACK